MSNRRRVVGNISVSLDGAINGPGGDYDMSWIVPHAVTPAARAHMVEVTGEATTALLGRKNYQGFSGYWPSVADNSDADPADRTFSRWLNEVEKVVFASEPIDTSWTNTRQATESPEQTVRRLRDEPGADIIVLSSASLIRALVAADELDRLCLTLCPEIAGGGARLFDTELPPSSWQLSRSTPTESGAIVLQYDRSTDR